MKVDAPPTVVFLVTVKSVVTPAIILPQDVAPDTFNCPTVATPVVLNILPPPDTFKLPVIFALPEIVVIPETV